MNILRREKLKEFIRQKQVVSLKQLTQEFNDVSVMTLHRDLDYLAKEGFILRIRGGAKYLETEPKGEGIEVQDISNKSQKDIVAQKAVRFVKEGSSIFLDGGTTMLELAKIIPDMYINVTTNGPNIALEIAEKMKSELQEKTFDAGIEILEVRITHLAYAEEIAAAMLKRQQAAATIAAREQIVEGAVGMVHMALDRLEKDDLILLDDERKAAMVSNLLVVLCGDKEAQPVVNSGSLY